MVHVTTKYDTYSSTIINVKIKYTIQQNVNQFQIRLLRSITRVFICENFLYIIHIHPFITSTSHLQMRT